MFDSIDMTLSQPKKRSLTINGHQTSITLEDAFWDALRQVAKEQGMTVTSFVAYIDKKRDTAGLSSAIRVYLVNYFIKKASTVI